MRRAALRRVRGRADAGRGDVEEGLAGVAAQLAGGESGIGDETGMRVGDAGVRWGQGNSWPNMDGLRTGFRRADFFTSTGECVGGGAWIWIFLGDSSLAGDAHTEEAETLVAAVSVLAVERSLSVDELEDVDFLDLIPVLVLRPESLPSISLGSADDKSNDGCACVAEARGLDQEGARVRTFFADLERIFSSSSE